MEHVESVTLPFQSLIISGGGVLRNGDFYFVARHEMFGLIMLHVTFQFH